MVQLRHSLSGRKQDRTGFRGHVSQLWQRARGGARRARPPFLSQTFLPLRRVCRPSGGEEAGEVLSWGEGDTFLFTLAGQRPCFLPSPKKYKYFFLNKIPCLSYHYHYRPISQQSIFFFVLAHALQSLRIYSLARNH